MPRLDIASSDLRRRIAAGEPVDFLVPPGALRELRARESLHCDLMTDSQPRSPSRTRDRWAAAGVVVLAIVAGVLAAEIATPQSWEQSTPTTNAPVQGRP